jgi:NADH-quinone oxidoreductase subunit M
MINALLWAPLAFGFVGLFLPKKAVGWWATAGALVTLVIGVIMAFGFHSGQAGLQDTVNTTWISGLGVNYSLGIDGLNLFLVLLTAVLWVGGRSSSSSSCWRRRRRRSAPSSPRTCCSSSSSST